VIDSRFAAVSRTAGFRCSTAIDSSPVRLAQTRLAVARAKEGDQEAFRFLYTSYANNVYGYVRSIVRDDYDAEDVTQLVFTKLMTRIDKYDERGVPFFAWLFRLARNVAIDHLRANRLTPVETVSGSDERDSADPHRTATVTQALAALPRDQREVAVLRHLVGLTPHEIADRMGRTESSVHGLHHRARRALQTELMRLESAPVTRTRRDSIPA
jgi:RNA polymerase sigma-70 factor, ECF subfamily